MNDFPSPETALSIMIVAISSALFAWSPDLESSKRTDNQRDCIIFRNLPALDI